MPIHIPAAGERSAAVDAFVDQHTGLVFLVAKQLARRSGTDYHWRELLGFGFFGLLRAAHGFDPAKGYSFATYAVPRIRGAMLDGMRTEDELPRSVRRKQRALKAHDDAVGSAVALGIPRPVFNPRGVSDGSRAAASGDPERTLRAWRLDVLAAEPISIDAENAFALTIAVLAASGLDDDEAAILEAEIQRLPPRQRHTIQRLYRDGLKQCEVARELGVTASAVCQFRRYAIARLRQRLGRVLCAA